MPRILLLRICQASRSPTVEHATARPKILSPTEEGLKTVDPQSDGTAATGQKTLIPNVETKALSAYERLTTRAAFIRQTYFNDRDKGSCGSGDTMSCGVE